MAGSNGYARELFAYFNKVTGFDSVSLICTNYDDCLKIKNKQGDYLSFGSVYPQFGKEGIHSCLYDGGPQFLKRGEVYYEKS